VNFSGYVGSGETPDVGTTISTIFVLKVMNVEIHLTINPLSPEESKVM
jgi:hypothetical protein